MPTDQDRIQKQVWIKGERARVWKAIADSSQFGRWFGMKLDGPFKAGETVGAEIAPTEVDPETAEKQKAFAGVRFDLDIEAVEPERLFSFCWHPFAIDKTLDLSHEPKTLVTFELSDKDGGVLVVVTESGFSKLPLERRTKAFAANEGGWEKQMQLIAKFLA